MGTTYSIKIADKVSNDKIVSINRQVDSLLNYINMIASTYISDSEIMTINNSLHLDTISISNDMDLLLSTSNKYYNLSGGYYDVTVGPLVDIWGFGKDRNIIEIPSSKQIDSVMLFVGSDKIEIFENKLIKKTNPKVKIDLSSIAKGYAVDRVADILLINQLSNFMINIGGEITVRGYNYNKRWSIGLQNPIGPGIVRKLYLDNNSIATSGTYMNFHSIDNKKYPHLIDPLIGQPVPNHIVSATIQSPNCIDADAIATMVISLGYSRMMTVLRSLQDIKYYIIINDGDSLKVISSFD